MANYLRQISLLVCVGVISGCSAKYLKYEKSDYLKDNQEFENKVKIVLSEEEEAKRASSEVLTTTSTTLPTSQGLLQKPGSKNPPVIKPKGPTKPLEIIKKPSRTKPREPELEGQKGFDGRRPVVDPFWVGEKVVHSVRYLRMNAGTLTLEVKPFAEVNGKRSYNFKTAIKSSELFSSFYSLDDYVNTLLDFETLIPSVFTLHVKETSQLREARAYFDSKSNQATFWEKKVTKKKGVEEKKINWEIMPFSQNVFSAIFYMRVFQWGVGVENAFRIADAGDNLVFRAKALRREQIETPVGKFKALVVRPEVELKGVFKPTGDNYIWISDDDRKLVLRIESKIKIGSLVSEIISLDPGIDPTTVVNR